ncbi:MAG: type IV pilus secretin PilQ [Nitrospirota bacterium]
MKRWSEVIAMNMHKGIFLITAALVLLGSLVAAEGGYAQPNAAEITGIEVLDNVVRITVAGPLHYKVNKTDDPFRVTVDVEGASLGSFRDKMFSKGKGITEIVPTQVQNPPLARLSVLLQNPSTVSSEVSGDTITITVKEEQGAAAVAAAEAASGKGDAAAAVVPPAPHDDEAAGSSDPAEQITEIAFNKTAEGAELIIKGDGAMPDPAVFELEGKIMVDVPGVSMKAPLPQETPSPVRRLRHRADDDKVRFVLDIEKGAGVEVVALDDEVIVEVRHKDRGVKNRDGQGKPMASSDQARGLAMVKETPKLISLDFQDADIIPILRLLGDVSGYNIVVHPDVKGKITMKLMNVPWEQALDIVLKTFALEKIIEGNIIRVATLKAFQDEKKAVADTKEVFGKAEDIETKVFTVNYANVEKVRESIDKAKVLSPRGNISFDTRTRSLIVKDIASSLADIQSLVIALDKPTPQVLIEARMVEVNKNLARDLGVQWGVAQTDGRVSFGGTRAPVTDVSTYTSSPVTQVGTGQASAGTTVSQNLLPLVVNLPAAVGPGAGATFGFGWLNKNGTLMLDFRLSALESSGKGKVVSSPKIMTLENEQAIIRHGAQIPVTTRMPDGTFSTTYKDANIKLAVIPQVAPDGTVLMKLEVTKDEPDFSRVDELGNPTINSRAATTQVLLKSGETIAIGGILKSNETESESAVPGVSRIPILGRLFKRDTKSATVEELLIFITPSIVNQ